MQFSSDLDDSPCLVPDMVMNDNCKDALFDQRSQDIIETRDNESEKQKVVAEIPEGITIRGEEGVLCTEL